MKRRNGFSIVSVIVGLALAGVLALIVVQISRNAQKSQANSKNSLDFDNIKSSVRLVLSKSTFCKDALLNKNGTPLLFNETMPTGNDFVLKSIKIPTDLKPIAEVGQKFPGGLEITDLTLTKVSGAGTDFIASLVIVAKKSQEAIGGTVLSNEDNPFRFAIKTGAGNTITDCGIELLSPTPTNTPPAGFADAGSFFVMTTRSTTMNANFMTAFEECNAAGATLCSWAQWNHACKSGIMTDKQVGKFEWIDGADDGYALLGRFDGYGCGAGAYGNRAGMTTTSNMAVRCCKNK